MALRTVRALLVRWRAEVMAAAQYRVDFAVGLVVQIVWLGVALGPVLFATAVAPDLNGWSRGELMALQAVWYLLDGVMWIVVVPNMVDLSNQVSSGSLDMTLLKPIDSLLYTTLQRVAVDDLGKIPLGFALLFLALVDSGSMPSVAAMALAGVALGSACVLAWSIGVLSNVRTLTMVRFDAGWVSMSAHNLARVPTSFYGPALRVVLTAFVPIAFYTTVPVGLLIGHLDWWWAVAAVVVAAVAFTVTRLAWQHQVRRYSGAMS